MSQKAMNQEQKSLMEANRYSFTPRIDPRSRRIASQEKAIQKVSQNSQERSRETFFPFKPQINQKSKKMAMEAE